MTVCFSKCVTNASCIFSNSKFCEYIARYLYSKTRKYYFSIVFIRPYYTMLHQETNKNSHFRDKVEIQKYHIKKVRLYSYTLYIVHYMKPTPFSYIKNIPSSPAWTCECHKQESAGWWRQPESARLRQKDCGTLWRPRHQASSQG